MSSSRKLSKAPGVKGRLGVWHRDCFFQVTLGGHPLYRFSGDTAAGQTSGEGLTDFGGGWWAVSPAGNKIVSGTPGPGY